ncbi:MULTISPECIES: hypothetical protein [unclassified Streptomyces]|uniref:hypothetical protein n=1 Tax=unclassified Streptomyces TaxID=2593676 RepID=UPI001BEBC3E3|nr:MULTISPECIES: hypothetical protein [unclassified Streptomyces]MBT2404399.1 hypothetical protein [Streptomyces sp. ISL-21]MBT2607050.1 hypothetical protein [Streptomyces sp. ISL-87]
MELDKPQPPQGEGCLVGVVRIPVKIMAVLVILPVRVVWDLLVTFGRMLNRRVLRPVGQGLLWFYARAVRPVLRGLGWVAAALLKLVFVWPWVGLWRYVLTPVGRGLAWLGRWAHTYLFRPVCEAVAWLLRYVLVPLAEGILRVGRVLGMVLTPIGRGLAWLGRGVAAVLAWSARALFVWPWVGLWRYVVTPVAFAAYRYLLRPLGLGVLWLARELYVYVLTPLGHLLLGAWRVAGRISRALGRGILWLWRGLVARPAAWVYRHVATPVGHAAREAWRTARAAVREVRGEVRRVLFGAAQR